MRVLPLRDIIIGMINQRKLSGGQVVRLVRKDERG
jgi:hypothetical protein